LFFYFIILFDWGEKENTVYPVFFEQKSDRKN